MWGVALTCVIKFVIGRHRRWALLLSGNAVAGKPRQEHVLSGFGDGRVCAGATSVSDAR